MRKHARTRVSVRYGLFHTERVSVDRATGGLPVSEAMATPHELADYLHVTENRLAHDRCDGKGPRFVKYGKNVRYRWADVRVWEEAHLSPTA